MPESFFQWLASAAIAGIFWRGGAGKRDSFLFYLEVVQRSVVFGLALVIITILFVLSRYPLHLNQNAYFSSLFFSLLFLSDAARLLIDSLAPRLYNRLCRLVRVYYCCSASECLGDLLRPERAAGLSRVTVSTPGETHLLAQLESLNEFLDSAGRR